MFPQNGNRPGEGAADSAGNTSDAAENTRTPASTQATLPRDGVTSLRHFSGKMSGSRNGTRTRDGDWDYERSVEASCCYWCRDRFAPGRMRYPILHEWKCQPVSLCLDCFKHPDAESYDPAAMQASAATEVEAFSASLRQHWQSRGLAPPAPPKRRTPPAPRKETTCPGCGEPIFVSPNLRSYQLQFCSMRCYQREYRRRRRNTGSAIDWKLVASERHRCAACKKLVQGRRRDAKFCSDRCRQWHYRRRRQDRSTLAKRRRAAP